MTSFLTLGLLLLSATSAPTPRIQTFEIAPGQTVERVWIEPGTFGMGPGDAPRPVTLSEGFWIGRTEVRWREWRTVMGWDDGRGQPDHPARGISWFEIEEFLDRLDAAHPSWDFRLPTEAEWEYVARAGSSTAWPFGNDPEHVGAYAWTRENTGGRIRAVATREPNPWGLYDLQGNVWEWVADWFGPLGSEPVTDPEGPATGSEKVRRGGSAIYGIDSSKVWVRYQQPPESGNGNLGFRWVMVAAPLGEGSGAASDGP